MKCLWWCLTSGILVHGFWEYKLEQPLWKTVRHYLIKLKIQYLVSHRCSLGTPALKTRTVQDCSEEHCSGKNNTNSRNIFLKGIYYVNNFLHEYRINYVYWVYQQALRADDFSGVKPEQWPRAQINIFTCNFNFRII